MADPTQEQFQAALHKGAELLTAGKITKAREHLEIACQLNPKDANALNLLGMSYFKQGLYAEAIKIFESLVIEKPTSITLRMNLGLVYLKCDDIARCMKQFDAALHLDPSHKKAHNYLGLALAQVGNYAQACTHFKVAGNKAMAEKMTHAFTARCKGASAPVPEMTSHSISDLDADDTYEVMSEGETPADAHPENEQQLLSIESLVETNEMPLSTQRHENMPGLPAESHQAMEKASLSTHEKQTEEERTAITTHATPLEQTLTSNGATGTSPMTEEPLRIGLNYDAIPAHRLTDIAAANHWPNVPSTGPFYGSPTGLAIALSGEILTRLTGLVALTGNLNAKPEVKYQNGRRTREPFGRAARQLQRVSGHGVLYFEPKRLNFFVLDFAQEDSKAASDVSVYVRGEKILAFEEQVAYNNGRITSRNFSLDLVHLQGAGKVLLNPEGTLKAVAIPADIPLVVPFDRFIGWFGRLTPRLLSFEDRGAIELGGDGYCLIDTLHERP